MTSEDLCSIVTDAVAQIVAYGRQKAIYEADCRVRAEMERARGALFDLESTKCRMATVELTLCKRKLERLQKSMEGLPEGLLKLITPLTDRLAGRIETMRSLRKEPYGEQREDMEREDA